MNSNEDNKCCGDNSNKLGSFDSLEEEWRTLPVSHEELTIGAISETFERHDVFEFPSCACEFKLLEMEIESIKENISSDIQKILARTNGLVAKNIRLEKVKKSKRFRSVVRKKKGCAIRHLNVSPKLNFLRNSDGKRIPAVAVKENLSKVTFTFLTKPKKCPLIFYNLKLHYLGRVGTASLKVKRKDFFSGITFSDPLQAGYSIKGHSITFSIKKINRSARRGRRGFPTSGIPVKITGWVRCKENKKIRQGFAIVINDQ